MLIIIITAVVLGVGIILSFMDRDSCEYIGAWLTVLGGIFIAIEMVILITIACSTPAEVAKYEKRYESLTYQYDNDLYDNDNDVGKKELMKEIQEWNEDIAANKMTYRSPWIGWFVPDEFAEFDFIELKGAGK